MVQRRSDLSLEALVFVVGASTLGTEIAAARLMAPFFGASTVVWANTIAVVLVALALGYWFGGRVADRHPHAGALRKLVVSAAMVLGVVPLVAAPFLALSVRAFDDYSVGAFAGSLLGVLALIALPVLMLGAVSPWAIRLSLSVLSDSGRTAGRMYAIATVGSLLGTFLASLVLIPFIGTQRTFLVFSVVVAGAACVGLARRWLLVPIALALLLAVPPGATKLDDAATVLYETETAYQYVRIVEEPDGVRRLELNERQATHSLYRPGTVLTGGVWDGYLALPFAIRDAAPDRIAILGFGAGTTARAYARYFPATRIDGVELDGELLRLGKRFFGLQDRRQLRLYAQDAPPFLRRSQERYDAILIDAYRQPYISFYLATAEFFDLVRARLRPGGLLIVNAGSDALERTLTATLASVFPHVARDPLAATNTLLVASAVRPDPARLRAAADRQPGVLRPLLLATADRLAPGLTGGDVYTDARAPVEWLIDSSIVEHVAGG